MKELWVPVSAAISQQQKVDTLANNVANANTPGFKKAGLTFREHLTVLEKGLNDSTLPNKTWSPEDFYRTHGNENSYVNTDGSYTDFSQGQIIPTGNIYDVALKGSGFFEVLSPNGVRYTRKGNLTINNEGRLATDQGYYVLSESGNESSTPESRIITLPQGKFSITKEGVIISDDQEVANISIAEFEDPHALKKEGNSLFSNVDQKNIKALSNTMVFQGYQEQSNVNVIQEMSELIRASRNFESIQRVIKTYDNMAEKLNNNILRF
jgi:flagellar basal-body rod protein FlgF